MTSAPTALETDPVSTYAAVARLVRQLSPTANRIRIVYDTPGTGRSIIAVPVDTADDSLEGRIVSMLNRLRPGEWISGKALAASVDCEPDNGHYRRTAARLVSEGVIESNRNLGYRMTC